MENDKHDIDNPARRQFIAGAGAAVVLAGVDALGGSSLAQSGKTPHVIIVGAGLAGLCAAYQLQQKRWTYTILEAERQHVGGRVRTRPIGNGLYWEAGAMRIPKAHKRTLDYIEMLGLKPDLRPFVMYSKKTFYFSRKTRATSEEDIKRQYNLTPAERAAKLWDLTVKNIATGTGNGADTKLSPAEVEQLKTANTFTSQKLISLDRQSLRQLMHAAKLDSGELLSDEAVDFTLFSSGNLAIQHGAATEFLREESLGVWDEFSRIKGGTWRFPKAFQSRLTNQPKMGCEVIRLEQDQKRGRVWAIYRTGGRIEQKEGDFLICTVPFPVLARMDVDPPFSDEKRRAILEMGYDSGTKVALLTKNRFWEKKNGIYGGSSTTDLMTGAIVYPSDNARTPDGDTPIDPAKSDRPGVLIAGYAWGQDARRLGAMPAREREAFAIKQVAQVHPELHDRGMVLQTASWAWDTYRWSGGAFAFYQPGQFARMHKHVISAEGRIYFAGEHCSHSHSWMEGALESADSAVAALVAKAG